MSQFAEALVPVDSLLMTESGHTAEYYSELEQLFDSLLADLDNLVILSKREAPAPGESDPKVPTINHIFRTIHSVKGLTGMMGLPAVQQIAHEFEDLLEDLRMGTLAPEPAVALGLQEIGAALASYWASSVAGSQTVEELDRLRTRLGSLKPDTELSSGASPKNDHLPIADSDRALLNRYEQQRVRENLKTGIPVYDIHVAFPLASLDEDFAAMTARLEHKGEVIASIAVPGQNGLNLPFRIIFAANIKKKEIERRVASFRGRVRRFDQRAAEPVQRSQIEGVKTSEQGTLESPPGSASRLSKPEADSEMVVTLDQSRGADFGSAPEAGQNPATIAVFSGSSAQEPIRGLARVVRVDLASVNDLSSLAHELSIETQALVSMAAKLAAAEGYSAQERFGLKQSARRIERKFLELEERMVELRMVDLGPTFGRAARMAERLGRELGKPVRVELSGRGTQIDKVIVDRIADPIYHILRNAVDHGIESDAERSEAGKALPGRIKIEGTLEGTRAIIAISDDGRGINQNRVRSRAVEIGAIDASEELTEEQTLRLIFRPGFSTASKVSSVSGRGVGLDAAERTLQELGGEIRISSAPGRGTRFELAVPTTLMMISAFLVRLGEWRYAINVGQIVELMQIPNGEITGVNGSRQVSWRGTRISLIDLKDLLGIPVPGAVLAGEESVIRLQGHDTAVAGNPDSRSAVGGSNADAADGDRPNGGRHSRTSAIEPRIPIMVTRFGGKPVAIAVESFEGQREIIVKWLGTLGPRLKGITGAVDLEGGDVALVLDLPGLLALRGIRV